MPVAAFPECATDGETLAIDAGQAADVSLLRADQSPLPAARLFTTTGPVLETMVSRDGAGDGRHAARAARPKSGSPGG